MFQKLLKLLSTKVPNWLRGLVYTVALLETIFMVVNYFRPDLLFNLLMWL